MWTFALMFCAGLFAGGIRLMAETRVEAMTLMAPAVSGAAGAVRYANAIARFVAGQPPGFSSPGVPDALLGLPGGGLAPPGWTNRVVNGTVLVFPLAGVAPGTFGELVRVSGGASSVRMLSAAEALDPVLNPFGMAAQQPFLQIIVN